MPIYEFENEAGETREEFFHVSEAVSIGAWTLIDGMPWRRVVSAPALKASVGQENYRLHSEACPNLASIERAERRARYLQEKGHAVRMPVRAPAYDEVGRAVFKSPKELHDYCARDGRFKVGNPKEISQQHRAAVVEKRNKDKANIAARERACLLPEAK